MVKILSKADKDTVAAALAEAERTTAAELVVVIAPASDIYQSYLLLYGLIAGSAIDLGLWATRALTAFPSLLAIEFAVMALFSFTPWLRHLLVRLVPKSIRHHRAAHRAFAEYQHISHHVSAATPIVLFYVSLAERYVHILPSRQVREKIPHRVWENIVREFMATLPKHGLKNVMMDTITQIARLLAPHFPAQASEHHVHNAVIERSGD